MAGNNGKMLFNPIQIIHPTLKTKKMRCKCCNRVKELRTGFCFDCADCESVIAEMKDMDDKPIIHYGGFSNHMNKLKYILEKFKAVEKENA